MPFWKFLIVFVCAIIGLSLTAYYLPKDAFSFAVRSINNSDDYDSSFQLLLLGLTILTGGLVSGLIAYVTLKE